MSNGWPEHMRCGACKHWDELKQCPGWGVCDHMEMKHGQNLEVECGEYCEGGQAYFEPHADFGCRLFEKVETDE